MIKKINGFLEGWPMTIVGGVFLIASFILPRMGFKSLESLAWVCVIICGLPLIYLSIFRIIHNKGISKISSALLISVAMIAAILIGDLFAAGEVAFIMEIGALLEDMTTNRARKGLSRLMSLSPKKANVIENGVCKSVLIERVKEGDIIRVMPGEVIPVDGEIIKGETSIDQSVMTGESLPIDKTVKDSVFSGTLNLYGSIDYKATKVGKDSSLQKLIQMVKDADKNQAPTQRIADKWASYLVPVALLIAIVSFIVTKDIVRAVTVMVVFCPCALVLATPTAIMAAIGQATKHGVIIKSGEALEKMGKVNIIAFDKTGTLTHGKLEVTDVIPFENISQNELLSITASLETKSEHPLAKAIVKKAKDLNLLIKETDSFKMAAGKGINASLEGASFTLGSETFIKEAGLDINEAIKETLNKLRKEGKATVIVGKGKTVIGLIALSDVLRFDAIETVRRLKKMNVSPVLLTGDNKEAAGYFSKRVGIDEVFSELLPDKKLKKINSLKEAGTVCMVGDGVNDAPALKAADVGVSMGAMGSDISIEASDVALMTDDLSGLCYLKWLSNTTVKTIKGAITLSMCINFLAIILSVLGILTPTTGALVHNAGSCFVVLLAALLYDRKYK